MNQLENSDSALYTENNLKLMRGMTWVTRVPLSISEAKEIVSSLCSEELTKSEIEGYSWKEIENNYAGILSYV